MQIYLPIAEMSVNVFLILAMGGVIGFLSGLFGVGGGFLLTPLLIFIGVPPPVAVATQANQVVASSASGILAHLRRRNVDIKMGVVLLAGGLLGSWLGVELFSYLVAIGQVDLTIVLSYVLFLGVIGLLMLVESGRAIVRRGKPSKRHKLHPHTWLHRLPLKMRFRTSRLYVSALLPFGIGFVVGVLAAIMGVGGGFIMIPAMIYLLGMPTNIVIGTSLFQILFVTANVTFLQAYQNQAVDVTLALLLIVGGVIGTQLGVRFASRLRGEQLRGLLAVLVLLVVAKLLYDVIVPPGDPYSFAFLSPLP